MTLLQKYFPEIPLPVHDRLLALEPLYQEWNGKINVISRKDIENLLLHHILHSLSIARAVQFRPGETVIDAGTGGGFPGIPLAILFPDTHFTLVDSTAKKLMVVDEICGELRIANVTTLHARFETMKTKVDFITGRAVHHAAQFISELKHLISPSSPERNGFLYLSGPEVIPEVEKISARLEVFRLSDWFEEEWFGTKVLLRLSNFNTPAVMSRFFR